MGAFTHSAGQHSETPSQSDRTLQLQQTKLMLFIACCSFRHSTDAPYHFVLQLAFLPAVLQL